jgi:hypothetical protein
MDAFDVNLLSQVKALNQKMSISQEQIHLKRKATNEDKGKGRYPGKKLAKNPNRNDNEYHLVSTTEEKDSIIDITI